MIEDPEQDVKWDCLNCGNTWYDEYRMHFNDCAKCGSEDIVSD